ncbi:MAG: 30S ribosomal protein S8e [Candidatus Aenigmatarchaeota archaeon]
MAFWHLISRRTKTGGRFVRSRKKRKFERGGFFCPAKAGEQKIAKVRTRGGNEKQKVLSGEFVNVGGKKLKITGFVENKSNFRYNRAKVITKGAVLETEKGNVRVTSRPGQDGTINGIFVRAEK